MQIHPAAAFARDRAADDIDDAEHAAALALDFLHGGERIEGFAGLTDCDVQRVLFDHGIAITKLGSRLGVRGNTRQLLDEMGADRSPRYRRSRSRGS